MMASYADLADKAKALEKLFRAKQVPSIPKGVIDSSFDELIKLLRKLEGYFPPSASEKREAKEHPTSVQIANFTTLDPTHKKVFNLKYFQQRFRALPKDKKIVVSTTPNTLVSLRNGIVLYFYRLGKDAGHEPLKEFLAEIEADYEGHPVVKREAEANKLLRKLLGMDVTEKIESVLTKEFPKEADLKDFAKITGLKIPPKKKGKNAPITSAHQRLAAAINDQGAFARI